MRPKGSPEELERRRFRAVRLLKDGYQPVEVAQMVGVDRRSVRRWKAAQKAKGIAALKAVPTPGRPSKLEPSHKKILRQTLLKGASKSGFSTDLWTCPRVGKFIRKHFGIRYHVDHICRLLRSLGFSPQKPERRAIERNEAAIRRWVSQDFPRIKKKPAN